MLHREYLLGLLIGLHDSANQTIGLGICEDVSRDHRHISVRTPVAATAAIRILQLGNVYLDERGDGVTERGGNPK
jgi:polynucleotide 5'-kinase involved in rRNA processing